MGSREQMGWQNNLETLSMPRLNDPNYKTNILKTKIIKIIFW
jgi:hypothetical protein